MQQPLQAASEAIDRLLQPTNLLQLAVIAGGALLGWWIASQVRPRLASADAPDDVAGRAREAAWVAAPYAIILLIVAAADGLLHATGAPAGILNIAVQLIGLLLLIRIAVYVLRVSLGARARLKGWGTAISFVLWAFLSLHLLGWGDTADRPARRDRHERRQDPDFGLVGQRSCS